MDCIYQIPFWVWIIVVWDGVWRLLALWRAARRGQTWWFVILAVFSTVGILPIIYLLTHRADSVEA